MNRRLIFNYIGNILRVEGVLMLPSLLIAVFRGETSSIAAFAVPAVILLAAGSLLAAIRSDCKIFSQYDGFVTVAASWILMSLFGCLPFLISGSLTSFTDALFETVSGFTTTGASIFAKVEWLPRSLLYWRSFTHWIGGMGVLVLLLAIYPVSKSGGGVSVYVFRAESPGPAVSKLVPTMKRTAGILYLIYIGLTMLQTVFLLCGRMPFFDSITTAFATAGTGGFTITDAGFGAYSSRYLQTVTAVFMVLFGVNFNIFYLFLIREFRSALKSEELRMYFALLASAVLLIAINISGQYPGFGSALHDSFFQVSSIMTTTGFHITDVSVWPTFSKNILLILMCVGACAGSTGGGIKVARILILMKSMRIGVKKLLNPRQVKTMHLDGKPADESITSGVMTYMTAYLAVLTVSSLILSLDGFDFGTCLASVLACFNNVGPSVVTIGGIGNYAGFSILGKFVLIADMLLGRLELFPLLLLFSPKVWARRRAKA